MFVCHSNILYVREEGAALSCLAHAAVATDKYRPETVRLHSYAKGGSRMLVLILRSVLRGGQLLLSEGGTRKGGAVLPEGTEAGAWLPQRLDFDGPVRVLSLLFVQSLTLVVWYSEYVELKNPGAAVEAYRAATALSPRDYRAWYGLGQTYELLGLPLYALHYYGRAAALRPGDARMWCAIGQCYESRQLDRADAALRCYRRALANEEAEGIALSRLAKLHERLGHAEEAAAYFERALARMDAEGSSGAELGETLQCDSSAVLFFVLTLEFTDIWRNITNKMVTGNVQQSCLAAFLTALAAR